MTDLKIGSICSGMGMCLHGLGNPIWAVEYDSKIAEVYAQNFPDSRIYNQPVQDVVFEGSQNADLIIATPSCKNASIANNKGEQPEDVQVASAIANIIHAKQPRIFLLENVRGYAKFTSFKLITEALDGYYFTYQILNLKDFGVAQSRDRLYLIAAKTFFPNIQPPKGRIKGWYEAIADLIPELPETELAPWQKAKFPELVNTCLIPDRSNWTKLIPGDRPAGVIRSGHTSYKALIKRAGGGRDSDRLYSPNEPAPTIRAMGRSGHSHQLDAVGDRVVRVTPRACLRLFGDRQTADKIWLPATQSLAMEVVGNGASWAVFQGILQHLENCMAI